MALLWCDGFDHYGADENNLLDGVWAEVSSGMVLDASNPRTGTHALRHPGGTTNGNNIARRVFGAGLTTVGFGHAFYLENLPAQNDRVGIAQFRDINNNAQISIQVLTTGAVRVVGAGTANRLDGPVIATSDDAVVTAGAYQHFECMVTIDDTAGAVEVRINGTTVIAVTDVDTKQTAESDVRQVTFGKYGALTTSAPEMWFDDVFCWDTSGSQNNDFIGDRRVITLFPNEDTAQADWSVVDGASPPGEGYEAIDEADPDDDDSYIATDTVGHVSEFELENVPADIVTISAIQLVNRMRKDDAGTCNVQASLVTGGSPEAEANGADRPITEIYTYWQDVIELDPDSAAPWTPEGFNASRLKLERTA